MGLSRVTARLPPNRKQVRSTNTCRSNTGTESTITKHPRHLEVCAWVTGSHFNLGLRIRVTGNRSSDYWDKPAQASLTRLDGIRQRINTLPKSFKVRSKRLELPPSPPTRCHTTLLSIDRIRNRPQEVKRTNNVRRGSQRQFFPCFPFKFLMPTFHVLPARRTHGVAWGYIVQHPLSPLGAFQVKYQEASVISGGDTIQGISGRRVDDVHSNGVTRSYLHFLLEPPTCGNGIPLQRSFFKEVRLDKHFT